MRMDLYVSYLVRIMYAIWHLTLILYTFIIAYNIELWIHLDSPTDAVLYSKILALPTCRMLLLFLLSDFPNVKKRM
jgi:hypothetical protein